MTNNEKNLQERAKQLGLGVATYSPGDGKRYVVKAAPHYDYFGDGDVYRAGCNPGNVAAFLAGVSYAQYDLSSSILRRMGVLQSDIAQYDKELSQPGITEEVTERITRNRAYTYHRLEVLRRVLEVIKELEQ
jgi:hypothetical protein